MKKYLILAALVAIAAPAVASEGDDPTSLSYISYMERYATVQPANQTESIEAVINLPLVAGDRIDTAREARMEVFLADGNTASVRVAEKLGGQKTGTHPLDAEVGVYRYPSERNVT